MQNATQADIQHAADMSCLSLPQVIALLQSKDAINTALQHKVATLEHQLDWFKRQLFGQKSERLPPSPDPTQMHLGEMTLAPTTPVVAPPRTRGAWPNAAWLARATRFRSLMSRGYRWRRLWSPTPRRRD